MTGYRRLGLLRLTAALCLTAPLAVRADFVTDWNNQILGAIQSDTTSLPDSTRNLAILSIGMYNAIESINQAWATYSYGTYTGPGTGPSGADPYAAATAAAYTIMQNLYPALAGPGSAIETQYNNHLATISNGQAKTDGINWGVTVANDILAWRSTDGSSGAQTPYTTSGLGHWQPTPPAYESQPLLPSWGSVTPFSITSVGAYSPPGLPGGSVTDFMLTGQYASDYNQVKDLGDINSLTRDVGQNGTEIAFFWEGAAGTVTTAGLWNQIAIQIATQGVYGLNYSMEDNARMLAALNIAMADATIVAWNAKYDTDFWRPVTAIAFGDLDGNGSTSAPPFPQEWLPLLETPNSPEYVSTHGAISGAAAEILAQFFGNNVEFSADSEVIIGGNPVTLTRSYDSLAEALMEAGMSRIYGGVSFNTSVEDGKDVGTDVAQQAMSNNFAAVPEPSGALLIAAAGFAIMLRRRIRR